MKFIAILSILFLLSCNSKNEIKSDSKPKMYVFLIAGQSNARGMGKESLSPNPSPGTVYQFIHDSLLEVTNEVGNLPDSRGSAWPTFGITYNQITGRTICFIPTAVDGSSQMIKSDLGYGNWSVNGKNWKHSIDSVDSALKHIIIAGYTPIFKGIIWIQGETDAIMINRSLITKTEYKDSLIYMISQYRKHFGTNTPFYIYQIGTTWEESDEGFKAVRDAQTEVVVSDSVRTKMLSTKAVTFVSKNMMADFLHWNQTALNEQGEVGAKVIISTE